MVSIINETKPTSPQWMSCFEANHAIIKGKQCSIGRGIRKSVYQ